MARHVFGGTTPRPVGPTVVPSVGAPVVPRELHLAGDDGGGGGHGGDGLGRDGSHRGHGGHGGHRDGGHRTGPERTLPDPYASPLGRGRPGVAGEPLDVLDRVSGRSAVDWPEPTDRAALPVAPLHSGEHRWPDPGDQAWPSVTTNPFGQGTLPPPSAERQERPSRASFGFPLQAHTPRRARRHTVEFARNWGLEDLVDAAELLVSELMTNALEASNPSQGRHSVFAAVAPLELRLSVEPKRHLRIEVRDHNPQPPVLDEPSLDEERGRGLLLVDNYAELWGYHRLPTGGKVVWCVIGPPAEDD